MENVQKVTTLKEAIMICQTMNLNVNFLTNWSMKEKGEKEEACKYVTLTLNPWEKYEGKDIIEVINIYLAEVASQKKLMVEYEESFASFL